MANRETINISCDKSSNNIDLKESLNMDSFVMMCNCTLSICFHFAYTLKNIELEYWHKVVNEYCIFAVYFLPILSVIFDHNCIGAMNGVTLLLTC